jgi:CBS domain-containing protein
MPMTIDELMTPNPVTLSADKTVAAAAKMMKEHDIGDVVVLDDDKVCGIVTDRDIVVRAIADNKNPTKVKLGDICSQELATLSPRDTVDAAVEKMRQHAVRRLPVVEGGRPVGIVTMGDLAVERDPNSALADLTASPPNR